MEKDDKRRASSGLSANWAGRSLRTIGRFLWYWLPPVAWMAMIFALSHEPNLPAPPGPLLDTLVMKTCHVITYGVLAWLFWRALRQHADGSPLLRVVSVGLAVLYGMSDEYHQSFVPGRYGRLWDVVIDGGGAVVAMLLDWWRARRRALSRQTPATR